MLTEFGIFMRQLRLDKSLKLKDMAKVLKVSSSFLSAVEYGKKSIPKTFYPLIITNYELTELQLVDLSFSIDDSAISVKLNLSNLNNEQREVALLFERNFSKLDITTLNALSYLLLEPTRIQQ